MSKPSNQKPRPPAVPPASSPNAAAAAKGADDSDVVGYYEAYAGFARTVRGWFMAFGIGGPALFIANPETWKLVTKAGEGRFVGLCFLTGVALQVSIATVYKSAMWYLYRAADGELSRETRLYKISDGLSEAHWLEIIIDLATIAAFAWATLTVFRVFAA